MSTFIHIPAAMVSVPLERSGLRPGADSGDPQVGSLEFDTSGTLSAGVWECEPGGWPVENRAETEFCYILAGHAVISDGATGRTFEVTAGDVIVQPKGWSGRWDVTETIRKVWAVG